MSELAENTLRKMAKIFGGLIPIEDAVRELRAKGIDSPEQIIRKMLRDGRLYGPREGFLSFLGDSYG